MTETDELIARVVHVVCRANQARSPITAAVLAARSVTQASAGPPPVVVSSGRYAATGRPAYAPLLPLLKNHGVDLSEHRSQPFGIAEPAEVWAVVTFETDLKRSLLDLTPDLHDRTFTLREIVRLAASESWRPEWNGAPEVVSRLNRLRPMVEAGDDDTPDPAGTGLQEDLGELVEELLRDSHRVADVLWGPVDLPDSC